MTVYLKETAVLEQTICIRPISAKEAAERSSALTDLLIDCVAGGATVSFLAPLARDKAEAFWRRIAESLARGERALIVAEDRASSAMIGTAQIVLEQPENQPHRADVQKVLVHRRARRRGIGSALLNAVEDAGRAAGKTLLMLDTTSGSDAERLYARSGWIRMGVVPGHALLTDGRPSDTTFFYKHLV
jgi:GNAT superfamily N-acetyltransferase